MPSALGAVLRRRARTHPQRPRVGHPLVGFVRRRQVFMRKDLVSGCSIGSSEGGYPPPLLLGSVCSPLIPQGLQAILIGRSVKGVCKPQIIKGLNQNGRREWVGVTRTTVH